jgi:hypothetical protein
VAGGRVQTLLQHAFEMGCLMAIFSVTSCACAFPGHRLQSQKMPSREIFKQPPIHFEIAETKSKIHFYNSAEGASMDAFKYAVGDRLDEFMDVTNSSDPLLKISLEARSGSLLGGIWSELSGFTFFVLPNHARETYSLRTDLISNGRVVKKYHYEELVDNWCWFFFLGANRENEPSAVWEVVFDKIAANLLADVAASKLTPPHTVLENRAPVR